MAENNRVIELTEDIEQYLVLQAQIKELSTQADAIKERLKAEALKEESGIIIAGPHSVRVDERTRSSINVKEFTEAHPRLAAKFTKVSVYNVVTIK